MCPLIPKATEKAQTTTREMMAVFFQFSVNHISKRSLSLKRASPIPELTFLSLILAILFILYELVVREDALGSVTEGDSEFVGTFDDIGITQ